MAYSGLFLVSNDGKITQTDLNKKENLLICMTKEFRGDGFRHSWIQGLGVCFPLCWHLSQADPYFEAATEPPPAVACSLSNPRPQSYVRPWSWGKVIPTQAIRTGSRKRLIPRQNGVLPPERGMSGHTEQRSTTVVDRRCRTSGSCSQD